jgi:hypothetical protein
MKIDLWPFEPSNQEEWDRWWSECYTHHVSASGLLYHPYWSVLFGGVLSGKSTILNWIRCQLTETSFILDYPPQKWPSPSDPPETNHLTKMMRLAAEQISTWISEKPERLLNLSETQLEYLRWLLEKFYHPRAYIRMVDRMPKLLGDNFRTVKSVDVYLSQTDGDDVDGQIEELVTICNRLDKDQLVYFIDIDGMLPTARVKQLEDLFQWQDLMHHKGFRGILALTERGETADRWMDLARGRMKPIHLKCLEEQSLNTINKLVAIATDGEVDHVEKLLSPTEFAFVKYVFDTEFLEQPIGAWSKWMKLYLERVQSGDYPISKGDFTDICREFYCRYLKIYFDPQSTNPGVWRGNQFIELEPKPYSLVTSLVSHQGRPADYYDFKIKKGNMHALVHRIREKIEPRFTIELQEHEISKVEGNQGQDLAPIYLHNKKGYGYWLEQFVDLSGE